jgi:hypothetical protein
VSLNRTAETVAGAFGGLLIDKGPAKASLVCVLHAQRGSMPEQLPLDEFTARCRPYFESGGCIIDQPFQPRLPEGMRWE